MFADMDSNRYSFFRLVLTYKHSSPVNCGMRPFIIRALNTHICESLGRPNLLGDDYTNMQSETFHQLLRIF